MSARGIGRRTKLALVAGLSAFLVLVGSTAGFAYWTASNSVSSTVGAASLTLAATNFTSANYTFGNETLSTTGSVTVTNTTTTTSTQAGSVTLTFSAAASTGLAGLVNLTLWPTTDTTTCTPTATPSGGTTALWSASTTVTTTLAKNASVSYCMRSVIANRESVAVSGGTLSFTPQISGTIQVGNFIGSTTATALQTTQYIYPGATGIDTSHWNWIRPNFANTSYNYCLDVSGAATSSGTIVISYGCKNAGVSNQQWMFTAVGSSGYYTIQPRNATTLRIDDNSTMASGGSITVNTGAGNPATATNQQWQLQQISTGVYQFVNAYSGMCLTSPGGNGQNLGNLTQTPCNGAVTQQYLISQAFQSFTCSTSNRAWNWSWASASTGAYHVLVSHGGTTTELATTASTASGASIAFSAANYGQGTYNVSFVDANNTLVGTGTIVIAQNANNNSCSGYDLQ